MLTGVGTAPQASLDTERATGESRPPLANGPRLAVVLLVALAASPIAVAALSLVGDSWHPVGDWASMVFRTSQVGTVDSPLVGTYTVKGWAHPGPFLFWASAPLYRLTGSDPRALEWTAALVNLASVVAIGALAWRRGRTPLLLVTLIFTALLLHGLGAQRLVDLWNPHLGLLPFFLVVMLAWDAALGRRESLTLAAIPASVAIQCHVAFGALVGLVALWVFAWIRWAPRLLETGGTRRPAVVGETGTGAPAGDAGETGTNTHGADDDPDAGDRSWAAWRRPVLAGLAIAAVLWLPPLVDLVVDTHNLASVVGHLVVGSGTQIGLTHGGSLVSRYVRPDGPWMGGVEPAVFTSVQGSGPVPVMLVLGLLAGLLVVARRRRLVDAVALLTLSVVLVVGAIPAAANLVAPAYDYLTQWLKIVGTLVWFSVAWTVWRLAEPWARAVTVRRRAVAALAVVALVGAAAWTWGEATRTDLPGEMESAVVQRLRAQVVDNVPGDRTYRVDGMGDTFGHYAAGVIFYMIEDGYDVVAADGWQGLKWGHDHRWRRGDPYDAVLTVAVHYLGDWDDNVRECLRDGDVELLAMYDQLSPSERRELDDLGTQRMAAPDEWTAAQDARALDLEERNLRVAVFAGDSRCGIRRPASADD